MTHMTEIFLQTIKFELIYIKDTKLTDEMKSVYDTDKYKQFIYFVILV